MYYKNDEAFNFETIEDNKMTKFEAEYHKKYIVCGNLVSARDKIAYHINCNWIYSAHWKDETWISQASQDCNTRIDEVKRQLNELFVARKMIDDIESIG